MKRVFIDKRGQEWKCVQQPHLARACTKESSSWPNLNWNKFFKELRIRFSTFHSKSRNCLIDLFSLTYIYIFTLRKTEAIKCLTKYLPHVLLVLGVRAHVINESHIAHILPRGSWVQHSWVLCRKLNGTGQCISRSSLFRKDFILGSGGNNVLWNYSEWNTQQIPL